MNRQLQQLIGHRPHEPARDAQARLAIGAVRPGLLLIGVIGALVNTVANPGSVEGDQWLRLGLFWLLQLVFWGLLHSRLSIETAALIVFSLDGAMLAATMGLSEAPSGSASTFLILIVIVGYFARPLAAAGFSVAAAITIAVIGPRLTGWNESEPIPTISMTALLVGLAMAYLSSRMRRDEREVTRLAEAQERSLARLQAIDRARDRLIENVSHELRTPLTAVLVSIETLARQDIELEPEARTQLLDLATDGGRRLLVLIEDLLTAGMTRPDAFKLEIERVSLGELTRDAVRAVALEDDRTIAVDVVADPVVDVDRVRMLQVIGNLLVNAVRHGGESIRIEADVDAGDAVLRVIDDGAGVPAAHVNELFMPFAKFSTRTDSTGLGLAICKALVEAHSGSIAYERTPEASTCFTVRLPLGGAAVDD